jgi:hypothetical protein
MRPVFGNVEFKLGLTRFVVGGLHDIKGEFLLVCIPHNLKKMSRYWVTLRVIKSLQMLLNKLIFSILCQFRDIVFHIPSAPGH